jgi:uncharacterized membrane protein YedE/YeeE
MTQFTPVASIVGGTLIGLAAVILYRLNGRIAGISGIFHGLIGADREQRSWRLLFIVGLVIGGLFYQLVSGQSPALVGIGTRLGSGCTSGHGVCGIARLSLRSIVATMVFLAVGMLTASLLYKVLS